MSFLSKETLRKVRLKGSEVVKLERLELEVRVVVPGSADALAIGEAKDKGGLTQSKLFPLILKAGLANLDGDMLGEDAVRELIDVLSLEELITLVKKIDERLRAAVPQTASPEKPSESSNTSSASPSAGPIPTISGSSSPFSS